VLIGSIRSRLNLIFDRWHDAGTYDAKSKTGGPNGSIRTEDELKHSANAGLEIAVRLCGELCLFQRKYFIWENVFSWKYLVIFRCLFAILKYGLENSFRHLACMKNCQMFFIFSYNLRSCEEKRQWRRAAEEESVWE
jgi:hypothetical protein